MARLQEIGGAWVRGCGGARYASSYGDSKVINSPPIVGEGVSAARGGDSNFNTPPPLPGTPPLRGVGIQRPSGL